MSLSNTQHEQNRRRFDIGSGVPLELLDARILEFIFHSHVRRKILGAYSGISDNKNNKRIWWDTTFGVGKKGNTDEVIALCTDGSDKVEIYKIFEEYGNIDAILGVNQSAALDYAPSHEWGVAIVQDVINRVGPKIYIATVLDYKDTEEFVRDHISDDGLFPKKRLIAEVTPKTGQNKILATSFFTGAQRASIPPSHPHAIHEDDLRLLTDTEFDNDTFPEARRALMLFGR